MNLLNKMNEKEEIHLESLKLIANKERKTLKDLKKYFKELKKEGYKDNDRKIIHKRINLLRDELKELNVSALKKINKINAPEKLGKENKIEKNKGNYLREEENYLIQEGNVLRTKGGRTYNLKDLIAKNLEKETLRRLRQRKKGEKKVKRKKKTKYSEISSKIFSKLSKKLLGNESFKELERNLIKANLDYAPTGYISMILFTTVISAIIGGFIFLFFLFFNIEATVPFITRASETLQIRFLKVFWILVGVPLGTFIMMYIYPSLEKKSAETKINLELPFATIHMSAISGSMLNPVKIFEIITSTKEYPALEKEFTKLLNEINIYGSDLVNALKNSAKNTPSKKLSELLNGLATTINSGGDLPKFFEKRSESLLFEYKLIKEKASKAAETFMDIYISILVAAPMVLMLLMMMMKLSGLGLSLSVQGITLLMVLGVVVANVIFISFLHMKRTE